MSEHSPSDGYHFDPSDPRAPTREAWDAMSPAERERVVAMLPSEWEQDYAPEGDPHRIAKNNATATLSSYFRRVGRKVYVSSELGVYYPNEKRFAPDVLAVLDVETHDRETWVVTQEGKGLDFVLEVRYRSRPAKDYVRNVELYARLGIREYFIFDRERLTLRGFRLPQLDDAGPKPGPYHSIMPQQGRYASQVIGLELMVDGDRLRFLLGTAPLPEAEELIDKLGSMLDQVIVNQHEVEARLAEETTRADLEAEARAVAEERVRVEAERARVEAERAKEAEARVRELERELAEIRAKRK